MRGLIDRSFPHIGAVVAGLVITVSIASLAVGQFIPPIQTDPPGPVVITFFGCEDPANRIEIQGLRDACNVEAAQRGCATGILRPTTTAYNATTCEGRSLFWICEGVGGDTCGSGWCNGLLCTHQ